MTSRQKHLILIGLIPVLTICGLLEVKRVTDTQIRHSKTDIAINGDLRGAEGIPVIDLGVITARRVKQYTDAQIANAIYKAENSKKYPYGIKSIKCSSLVMYRLVCLQSVKNGRERWIKAGCPGDFIMFLGEKYCPPADHPLNIHWVGNVYKYLERANGK